MLPQPALLREKLLAHIRDAFRRYGFVPIDTPILEYSDILVGPGGAESEKQLYCFQDQGGRDVTMRYDLTVPLARFVAQHRHELALPLRRYQMGKVFRGEKPQRGRFREFMQCDFDIIGSSGVLSDYDVIELAARTIASIIGEDAVEVHLSHREVLELFARAHPGRAEMLHKLSAVRVVLDKLHKIGRDAVRVQLNELLVDTDDAHIEELLDFVQYDAELVMDVLRNYFERKGGESLPVELSTWYSELKKRISLLMLLLREPGRTQDMNIIFDPSIMRGLDYYTGMIFEVYHRGMPSLGALASGGRYDALTARFSKHSLPAVGGSIGIDRMLSIPDIAQHFLANSVGGVLILNGEPEDLHNNDTSHYMGSGISARLKTADKLRRHMQSISNADPACAIPVEIYPEHAKLARQYDYAEQKCIAHVIKVQFDHTEKPTILELKSLHTEDSLVRSFEGKDALLHLAQELRRRASM